MIDEIIGLYKQANKQKLEFSPGIKIKLKFAEPVWIEAMYVVRNVHMLKVSTVNDDINIALNAVDKSYLPPLHTRLTTIMTSKK